MDFEFHCSCGKSHAVQPCQAGTSLLCSCGRKHVLPSLSKLRESSGLAAFEKSTADAVWAALNAGQFEMGDLCIECGAPTNKAHVVWAVCERSYRHISGGAQLAVAGIPVAETEVREEDRGRNVVVPLLIRLCETCASRFVIGWTGNVLRLMRWLLIAGGIGTLILALAWPIVRLSVPLRLSPILLAAAGLIYLTEWWLATRNQAILKSMICKIPVYCQLISEYPHAALALGKVDPS